MPTVIKFGPWRFYFYSGDGGEPPHIHVRHGNKVAKFWLNPVRLENSGLFTSVEINKLQKYIEDNTGLLLNEWNKFFNE